MTMSDREFRAWQVFTLHHPLPADMIDVHFATLDSIAMNLMRGDGTPPVRPEGFLTIRKRSAKAQDDQPTMSEAESVALAAGLR